MYKDFTKTYDKTSTPIETLKQNAFADFAIALLNEVKENGNVLKIISIEEKELDVVQLKTKRLQDTEGNEVSAKVKETKPVLRYTAKVDIIRKKALNMQSKKCCTNPFQDNTKEG
jgi:hypothetical protein